MDEVMITIPLEEYKELLTTKGKYEELVSHLGLFLKPDPNTSPNPLWPNITYWTKPIEPTCTTYPKDFKGD